MIFIQIDENYINIDHIVSIEKSKGHFSTVIRLSINKNVYTNTLINHVLYLIETAEKKGKEVSR